VRFLRSVVLALEGFCGWISAGMDLRGYWGLDNGGSSKDLSWSIVKVLDRSRWASVTGAKGEELVGTKMKVESLVLMLEK
jgi:hypothetical protein